MIRTLKIISCTLFYIIITTTHHQYENNPKIQETTHVYFKFVCACIHFHVFKNQKITFSSFIFIVCVGVCAGICDMCATCVCMTLAEARRGCQAHWSWSCRQLWGNGRGCWEPSSGPAEEQQWLLPEFRPLRCKLHFTPSLRITFILWTDLSNCESERNFAALNSC